MPRPSSPACPPVASATVTGLMNSMSYTSRRARQMQSERTAFGAVECRRPGGCPRGHVVGAADLADRTAGDARVLHREDRLVGRLTAAATDGRAGPRQSSDVHHRQHLDVAVQRKHLVGRRSRVPLQLRSTERRRVRDRTGGGHLAPARRWPQTWTSTGSAGMFNGSSIMYRPGKIRYRGGAPLIDTPPPAKPRPP